MNLSEHIVPRRAVGHAAITVWLAAMWTLWAAWCQVSGWVLSLLNQLGRGGYVIAFVLFFVLAGCLHRSWKTGPRLGLAIRAATFKPRWRPAWKRIPRLLFWSVCVLSLMGALFNTPYGYDAYGYRIARIVRWLQEGHYYWTGAADQRIDICSLASEWELLSILSITGSDRLLFLVNFVPFVLFPGLFYLAARGLGIRRQWALLGMWLVPLGYCFSLTSGGIQNDGVAGIHAAAAIVFLRSRSAGFMPRPTCLYLSLTSIAIISGLKLSNLPIAFLLLVWWLWISRGELRLMLKRPILSLFVAAVCLSSSTLPTAIQNISHEGNLSGDPQNRFRCEAKSLIAAPIANLAFLGFDAVTPNPFAGRMNRLLDDYKKNSALYKWLAERHFLIKWLKFQTVGYDGFSGPGFPILIGLPLVLLTALRLKRRSLRIDAGGLLLLFSGMAYSVYLVKMGSEATARISASYFPPLILGVLSVVSQRGMLPRPRIGTVVCLASAVLVQFNLVFSTLRPLLPEMLKVRLDVGLQTNPYRFHRYCAEQIGQVGKLTEERIYYVVHLGGLQHRLYSPYRQGGRAVEVGSGDWTSARPSGPGYLAISSLGIKRRYGLTIEEFVAKLGDAREIGRDRDEVPQSQTEMLRLYHLDDLSLIPEPPTQRMYVYRPE
jgi:hypothetical protein